MLNTFYVQKHGQLK